MTDLDIEICFLLEFAGAIVRMQEHDMPFKVDLDRAMLEKALEYAEGSATRASNQKGINPMIRELNQKDAKLFRDARFTMEEIKK